MYISLDIETTGLSYEHDDIIEIGAVKFDEAGTKDVFKTFLSIDYELPPIITHITGIKDSDLENAPKLEEVKETLFEFIGDLPIVAHNADFDLDFLSTKGLEITNPRFDTLQLSTIMYPELPSHSLSIITDFLKIEHKTKHRAFEDAEATAELFRKLKSKISEIDFETLEKIKEALKRSTWPLKDIFLSAESKVQSPQITATTQKHTSDISLEFDKDDILSFYKEGGILNKNEKDYEVRLPQIKMSEKIIDAMEHGYNLLCEAGTGTGKTTAYLLPSIFKAKSENRKVIISTHTKHLQDQLQNKDIPALQKAFKTYLNIEDHEQCFNSTVIKGRKNYLSKKRLELFMQKKFFRDHEATLLIKVLLWVDKTKTGDREEITLQKKEKFTWDEICCDALKCPHTDKDYSKNCFLAHARERAQNSDIVITNHALLASDTVIPSPVLPDHKYLIIDEAHHLESETTEALTINLTTELFHRPLTNIKNLKKDHSEAVDLLSSKVEVLFGILGIFYEKNNEYSNNIGGLTIHGHMKNSIEWTRLQESAENIYLKGKRFISELKETIKDEEKVLKDELESLDTQLNAIAFVLLEKSPPEAGEYITWMYLKRDGSPGVKSAPLHIGEHLSKTLFHDKESVILTSATLTVNNTFDYIRDQLSLGEDFNEIILPPHFSYSDQVEIVIHKNIPPPNSAGFFEQTCKIIKENTLENMGKMLVLFTSKRAVEATYLHLMPELKQKDITILAQNISGSRNKILELFKKDPDRSVIFGTNSFWEGIDIKGASLNCVIIQKLPFDPPDDPIHSARAKLRDDPFYEYQIPRAVLRFKQGFGRLIRSASDTGKIIILDSRVITKSYGKAFVDSLPAGIKINITP